MPKPPATSLGRKICDFRFGIYASSQYLVWAPKLPIADHGWVNLHEAPEWLILLIWDAVLKMVRKMNYLVDTLRARRDEFDGRKSWEYGNYVFDGNLKPVTRGEKKVP